MWPIRPISLLTLWISRGFDSSIILIPFPRPIGDFPEALSQAMLAGCNVSRGIGRMQLSLNMRTFLLIWSSEDRNNNDHKLNNNNKHTTNNITTATNNNDKTNHNDNHINNYLVRSFGKRKRSTGSPDSRVGGAPRGWAHFPKQPNIHIYIYIYIYK